MRCEAVEAEPNGDGLTVSGGKRIDREATGSRWRSVQCADGSFRRDLALPVAVRVDRTTASDRDGVPRIDRCGCR